MLIGIPGSGKSTWANDNKEGCIIASSDELRKELFGDVNVQSNNTELFQELHRRIKKWLSYGLNVIYDATNLNCRLRMSFLNEISKIDCHKTAIVFATPYEICLRRNWMRNRKVPDEVMDRMYRNFQTPWYFEGWDSIDVIYDYKHQQPFRMEDFIGYEQNNPHHTKDLGTHMEAVFKYLQERTNDTNLLDAGRMHDCGKPYTKFADENGDYHYYNHEHIGAYDALASYGAFLETSALINYHMYPIHWLQEKTRAKYEKLFGKEFYDKIMLLHEADMNAK